MDFEWLLVAVVEVGVVLEEILLVVFQMVLNRSWLMVLIVWLAVLVLLVESAVLKTMSLEVMVS